MTLSTSKHKGELKEQGKQSNKQSKSLDMVMGHG